MPEPIIYTIPDAYWGAKFPKVTAPKPAVGGITPSAGAKRVSHKTLFISISAVLFLTVVGGAGWYYTRGLRAPAPELPPPLTPPPAGGEISPPVEQPVTPPPTPPVEPTPLPAPTPSQDPDHDQLSEAEEVLYNTQSTLPDTDNDGFLDGHEVFHLYNPSGTSPEKLEPAGLVQRYSSPTLGFEILYPRSWVVNPEAGERTIVFQAGDGEAIKLMIVENLEKLELNAWLSQHQPEVQTSPWTSNKASLTALVAQDGHTIYLASGTNIFALSYSPQVEPPRYLRTLEMMANSLSVP